MTLEYPPDHETWEAGVADGLLLRRAGDNARWQLGWRAGQIEKRYGRNKLEQYAGEIGLTRQTIVRYKWVASRFTPEMVNLFPGLPFSMWELVTALAKDDIEAALDMIERAYDTPGLTIEAFASLVKEEPAPLVKPPPFTGIGKVGVHRIDKKTLLIGVIITHESNAWEERLRAHALYNQEAEIVLRTPNLGV